MDNPSVESTGALDPNQAAALFSQMLEPEEPKEEPQEPEAEAEPEQPQEEPEQEVDDDPTVTVKIDGKDVEVKLSELKNGYQRQADYTRKTMEVAEQRKAAESELSKAREERNQYAQALQQQNALLQAQLQEQNAVDWDRLLESDPVEFLKQQHLYQQRQAKLQQIYGEQQKIAQQQQAEAQESQARILRQQAEDLLAKLPDWKDEKTAKAEKQAIRSFLLNNGFTEQETDGLADHRSVIVARKAMLYDQMIEKAQTAAKKVQNLPQKTLPPSKGEAPNVDKRGQAYQRLSKSGSIDDAAAVFASLL